MFLETREADLNPTNLTIISTSNISIFSQKLTKIFKFYVKTQLIEITFPTLKKTDSLSYGGIAYLEQSPFLAAKMSSLPVRICNFGVKASSSILMSPL